MSSNSSAVQGVGLPSRGLDDLPGLQTEGADVLRGRDSVQPPAGSSGGEGDEDRSVLGVAASLRFPDLTSIQSNTARVNALIDYISRTAIVRGDLEELRLNANLQLREAKEKLNARPLAISAKSKTAAEEARRAAAPDLAREQDGARWIIDRCTEQINRLGGTDYDAASRAYTLLSGG